MLDWFYKRVARGLMPHLWDEALNMMEDENIRADLRSVFTEEVDKQYTRIMGRVSGHLKGSGGMFGVDQGIDLKAIAKNPMLGILYFLGGKGLSASPSNVSSGDFKVGEG